MTPLKTNVHISPILKKFFISLGLITIAVATFISCSDDNSPFSGNSPEGNGRITFTVAAADSWNSPSLTRSSADTKRIPSKTVTLSSPDVQSPLYMIAEERASFHGIKKDSSQLTRSSLISSSNISSFGAFAALRPDNTETENEVFTPDYMYNVEVTKDDSWSPTEEYLWPNKAKLHITAYSPFVGQIADGITEGITSLPAPDADSELSISFTTPSDVANQFDLMWATPVEADESPCDLTFNHALTAIKFVAGSQLAPCKIKKIEISGIVSSGILNIETGAWTLPSIADSSDDSLKDFSISPDLTLSASSGSSFVAPGEALSSDEEILLMIPQSLSSDSQISLTIETDGTEHSFNASLDGQTWRSGMTMIYRLSASPESDSLILDILDSDGNAVTTLQSHYTGGDLKYSVRSNYTDDASSTEMIPWKAEFVDDNGNVISRPQWITDFTLSGDGDEDCVAPTVMQEPTFAAMSDDTRLLRQASDINTSSGITPYNLSNATGASIVENTANCYVVSAPGKYSFPLVYGNAVKDGTSNESSYKWSTHTTHVLKNFINHLGNEITDPYIYNNSGCEPADAFLVWEGRLCLIENVKLSDDKHSVIFEVPATYIRQGNALIAVRDSDGNIMWSWQIWVTPYTPEDGLRTFSYLNHDYHIMARNIGEVSGGDDTYFEAQSAKVRFTQITPDGLEPKTVIVTINRDSKHVLTPFCFSFYQWGRKDPMISLIKEWYKEDHTEITVLPTQIISDSSLGDNYITTGILHPSIYLTGNHEINGDYNNLWNVQSHNNDGVKSVYDPSPVGFKIPGIMLRAFDKEADSKAYDATYINTNTSFPGLSYELKDGSLFMALLGYRQSDTGNEAGIGSNGSVWTSLMSSKSYEARCFQFQITQSSSPVSQFVTDPLLEGFGVRPIKDE